MNKRILLVLPLVTLLAGCGKPKTNPFSLPKGGRDLDLTSESDLESFADKINTGILRSYDALQQKAHVDLKLYPLTGSYSEGRVDYETYSNGMTSFKNGLGFIKKAYFNIKDNPINNIIIPPIK